MSPIKLSRYESGMRVVLEFSEALNRHDVEYMLRLINENCLLESASPKPDGTRYKGHEPIAQYWRELFRESPTLRMEIEDIFSAGSRCIAFCRWDWESEKGQRDHVRGVSIFLVENNLIGEQRYYIKA